jgi:single-stranded DNA-binding protein
MDLNHWTAIGKLEGDPVVTQNNDKEQVYFILLVNRRIQNANAQWVDQISKVPCYAFDRRATAIGQHCSAGQEVTVEAYYRSWDINGQLGHGMVIQNISFGFKPRDNNANQDRNVPM